MRFLKIICIWIASLGYTNGQSSIKCSLSDMITRAFNINPLLQRSDLQIKDAAANFQIQRSIFDYNSFARLSSNSSRDNLLEADPRNLYLTNALKSRAFDFSSGLNKRLRSGQLAEVSLNYGYNSSNFPFNNFNQNVGPFLGNNFSTINYSLTQPLLRGKGRNIVTISERTSLLYLENAKKNNEFANSLQILQIGIAYWNYYLASENLEIYTQNEARVRNVLEITKELVKADKKPQSDLILVNADLANQEKLTFLAEQNLYQSKISLGREVGLSNEESLLLEVPSNQFPTILESKYNINLVKERYIKTAKEKRADLRALGIITDAVEMQYKLAENNMKPQLDISGFVFHGSVSTGAGIGETFSSFTNNQGNNFGLGARLTFTFPTNNNLAKGNLAKSYIAIKDQKVTIDNFNRNIELNISIALNNLHNSVLVVEKAKEALDNYKEAFLNEQEKFQTGLTTLLNLILFQERLTSAELQYLAAYQQFANSIIVLRHETGTLVNQENSGFSVNINAFNTIPNSEN
jgi:outer membrane protein